MKINYLIKGQHDHIEDLGIKYLYFDELLEVTNMNFETSKVQVVDALLDLIMFGATLMGDYGVKVILTDREKVQLSEEVKFIILDLEEEIIRKE